MSLITRKLLCEELTYSQAASSYLEEDAGGGGKKSLYMQGIFIQGGVKNHNERVYPVSEIKKAVEDISRKLADGLSILGECDHPEELTINLERVSHSIIKMWMEGPNGMGKLKIIPTPMGNIIRTLVENEVKLGVSSRGVGNVSSNGEVDSFEMVTIDIVCSPSGPNCFPKPVFESLNSRRGRVIHDLAQATSHDPKAQKYLKEEILKWIHKL